MLFASILAACSPPEPPHACWGERLRAGPLPVELPTEPASCSPDDCDPWERRAVALREAGRFLAAWPGEIRYDAAIGTPAVRAVVDSDAWRAVAAAAQRRADADPDHPHRAWFDPAFVAPAASTTGWPIPGPGERIAYNAVVTEALHCAANGWRPQTEAYACGPMRDRAWGTTHAAWALEIARDAGCTPAPCLAELVDELLAIATSPDAAETEVQRIDLRAEAIAMALRGGRAVPEPLVEALIASASPDGAFGAASPDDAPQARYHAALVAAWALAEDLRARRRP